MSTLLFSAHFENLIDLTIKIEDGSYSLKVKSFKFNQEEIHLEPSDRFKPRKALQYKLPPGRYFINWATEKNTTKWSEENIKEHETILVLENGDGIVRVNVKGDQITMY